jgi:hypothetical protein
MPNIGSARIQTSAKNKFRNALNAELQDLVDIMRGDLLRASGVDGTILPSQEAAIRVTVGRRVSDFFTGGDNLRAYDSDGVTPLSPYAGLLNRYLAKVQADVVSANAAYMRRKLARYPEVIAWLESAQQPMQEQITPNPLLEYDAAHTWVDPRGYRLSDRIWQAGERTRAKLDLILLEGVREGKSAIEIAATVERMLLPNRAPIRTKKPYGTDVSFDAMRLARTEITRAFGQATMAASNANPYVTGIDWALSASHPRFDICDNLATIGMGGGRVREPYPKGSVPPYPAHPQELCSLLPFVPEITTETTAELVQMYEGGGTAPLTVLAREFLLLMLGAVLVGSLEGEAA